MNKRKKWMKKKRKGKERKNMQKIAEARDKVQG